MSQSFYFILFGVKEVDICLLLLLLNYYYGWSVLKSLLARLVTEIFNRDVDRVSVARSTIESRSNDKYVVRKKLEWVRSLPDF